MKYHFKPTRVLKIKKLTARFQQWCESTGTLINSCWALKNTVTLENYLTVPKKATNTVGCIPQTYKAYTCPVLEPEIGPGVSNRDMNGLVDEGAYMSEARSWKSPCSRWWAGHSSRFHNWGQKEIADRCQISLLVTWETSRWARPLTTPLISYY